MPERHPDITTLWSDEPIMARGYMAAVVLAFYLGVTLAAGGNQRAASGSYDTIRELGGTTVWGAVLGAGAVALSFAVLASPRIVRGALYAGAGMYMLLGLWFLLSAAHNPQASWWGPGLLAYVSWVHLSQALGYRR